jgi:hypothetical protein
MRTLKCAVLSILISAFLLSDIYGQIPGVVAGWNTSSMILIDKEEPASYDPLFSYHSHTGFNAGATLEIPVLEFLSVETGILLVKRGRRINSTEDFGGIDLIRREKHELYYFDIPLVARFRFNTGKSDVFASAGPYFSYGISGQIRSRQIFNNLTENQIRAIRWGTIVDADDYRRTDYGFVFSTGIERGAMNAGISYATGESNISPKSENVSVLENRLISISIGYKFGKAVKERSKKNYVVPEKVNPGKDMKTKLPVIDPQNTVDKISLEKLRADSLAAIRMESERLRTEKEKTDSIAAANERERIMQLERAALEKAKSDSTTKTIEQQSIREARDVVVYRVQFASSVNPKGSYKIEVEGKTHETWEYLYSGAYRSTAGEFNTLAPAVMFQNAVRKSGYSQAFIVAFRNNIRVNDPALFR